MGNRQRLVVAFVLLSLPAVAQATLVVPTAYPAIQAAIAAAGHGDTVLVLPGTYVERLDFLGKAIVVRSANGTAVTTIDGNQLGPVVTFTTNEGPGSVLSGFTLRNGRGQVVAGAGPSQGGGIHCTGASPTVRDCVLTANHGGAGSVATAGAVAGRGGAGGIVATGSALQLHDCVVDGNVGGNGGIATHVLGPAYAGNGAVGGIEVRPFGAVFVVDCALVGNRGGIAGFAVGSVGGAPGHGGHGAFHFTGASPQADFIVQGCTITGNVGTAGGPGVATGGGAGAVDNALSFTLGGSTIAGNTAAVPGLGTGGVRIDATVPFADVRNCILWGNTAPDLSIGNAWVDYCDVGVASGPLLGAGNLSADPLFVNLAGGDVHLTAASPCRHAGRGFLLPPFDVDGDPRRVGPAVDIGADEWEPQAGTREDFALELRVNGAFAPAVAVSPASGGDVVDVRVWSPTGALANELAVLACEAFAPPGPPLGPVTAPIHFGGGVIVLATFAGVGAGGVVVTAAMPTGLAGLGLRVQAFALGGAAQNGVYAATAARDVLLQ
jgi:hypothetical protein